MFYGSEDWPWVDEWMQDVAFVYLERYEFLEQFDEIVAAFDIFSIFKGLISGILFFKILAVLICFASHLNLIEFLFVDFSFWSSGIGKPLWASTKVYKWRFPMIPEAYASVIMSSIIFFASLFDSTFSDFYLCTY